MKTLLISILAVTLAGCASTSERPLTDPEIAMVMRVANIAEVREGALARDKATDPAVRDFAAMMVSEHSAQNSKAESEFAKVDIPSEDTELSRKIDAESGVVTERLRLLTGREFDRAYMDRQVEAHQSVLTLIDSKLIPAARKKTVREQLTELRTMVEKHLARAKQIQGAPPR
jgi:putative membrane protein